MSESRKLVRRASAKQPARTPNTAGAQHSTVLSNAFVKDILADWKAHGAAAIGNARTDRPHDYLKMITGLFPKEAATKVDALDEFSDEQLAARLAAALAELERTGVDPRGGTGPEEAS